MFEFLRISPLYLWATEHPQQEESKQCGEKKSEQILHFFVFLILSDVPGSLDTEKYLLDQRMNECMPMCCLSNF